MLTDETPFPETPTSTGVSAWFRRRAPRLAGTLHIRDAAGHEIIVPLRGRDTLLTAAGSGLPGYGEAWAVHLGTSRTGLLIVYGPTGAVADRRSGICPAGRTITLGGADFTWLLPPPNVPGHLRVPAQRTANTRADYGRFRNMVRSVTQSR
ncbi:hypothetical protein [Actinoplanes derwentensis]|uniref:Uncharacterized protein n=1 Tax=Actinoplanes derwentensis TaxID=113562 RepID=A0A1H1PFU8_9ACTN|nr:hypothetical protein [Actinoplanes derwentensis]SDS09993.1 hypothetical protein SAMN04489716_0006 [Actinoplanes derwentensis]SDT81415.1 hypothetical protein SAMN04489716_9621 [Actinoplanes derwentensis]SDT81427.1 hypothetical protein SAMN04489716_9630 [Actinoplanes derwentensis]